MNLPFRTGLVTALLLAATIAQADTTPLGRLFYDAQQRTNLDQQRQRNPGLTQPADNMEAVTVNGEVRSSSGRRTRWINGEADWNNSSPLPRVPVGNTYYPESGQNDSVLGNGQIKIKPARRTP